MTISSMGTPRYAPWLQKALRVKDETHRFWTQQQSKPQKTESPRTPTRAQPPPTTIWEDVEEGNVAEVARLLETTPSLVFQRRESCGSTTVLHEAAFHGCYEVVQLVLHHVETRFPGETLRLFVDAIDTVNSRTTPLIAACRGIKGDMTRRLKIIQLLIHVGADVEHQDAHGDNAIHWCARLSNNVLLRWLLTATDAGATAVFAENYKREKPLDLAKQILTSAKSQRFAAQNVYTSLRNVDRKCNVLLKMQVIKRQLMSVENERTAAMETHLATALATAQDAIDGAERLWADVLKRAEDNRRDAETKYITTAAETARDEATQWLESKDGIAYVKKQLGIATDELKVEILRGTITKPKDMRKAAAQRASEMYITQQVEAARQTAREKWRAQRPPTPATPDDLVQLMERL